jgi:hypothetical protein
MEAILTQARRSIATLTDIIERLHHIQAASAGTAEHPVSTERLMAYWSEGEGAAKIRWGVPGDYDRCLIELGKYVRPDEVHGLCQNLHIRATGFPAGHAPAERAAHK